MTTRKLTGDPPAIEHPSALVERQCLGPALCAVLAGAQEDRFNAVRV